MSPERLASVVAVRLERAEDPVSGFWYQVLGSRESYAERLREHLAGEAVAVLTVKGRGFDAPDAVLDDFVALIDGNRELCEKAFSAHRAAPKFGVVCLSRNVLKVPVSGSPERFPDWFPRIGGRTVNITIEEVTWTGEAPLNCPEAAIADLSGAMFDLEGTLLTRLAAVRKTAAGAADALWAHLRRDEKERFDAFLAEAAKYRDDIESKQGYRPGSQDGRSVVARLWRKVETTTPDRIGRLARALSDALLLPDSLAVPWHRVMVSILARPGERRALEREQFAHNLVLAVAAGLQFITASHHTERTLVAVPLVRSMSYDLREGLTSATSVIRGAEQARWPRERNGPAAG